MSIEVAPFEAGLGAEIRGVDIREPLSPQDRDAIRAAWLEHLVLRFRDQPMTDAQHMAFTRQFGELEFNPAALIAKQYGVETQTAGPRREIAAGNLGHLEHHRRRQGDRRARRRRGVLAHRQLVCRRAAGGEPVALARSAAAERRRLDLFPQHVFGL